MINEINSIEIQGGYFSPSAKFEIFKNNDYMSIIYGKNGSGKGSLSKAVSSFSSECFCKYYDSDHQLLNIPAERVFVFNEDFIKNQVQIKEEGLDAIVLLGERVDIEEAIEKRERNTMKLKKKVTRLKAYLRVHTILHKVN